MANLSTHSAGQRFEIPANEANQNPKEPGLEPAVARADLEGKKKAPEKQAQPAHLRGDLDTFENSQAINAGSPSAPTNLGRTAAALDQIPRTASAPGSGSGLQKLVARDPSLKTNQDLINHFMRAGGNDWERSKRVAQAFGCDLDQLVQNRQGSIQVAGTTASPGAAASPSNAPVPPAPERPARPDSDRRPTTPNGQVAAGSPAESDPGRVVPSGRLRSVYLENERDGAASELVLTDRHKNTLNRFVRTFEANKERYERVAAATGIPAKLIAAIHYRESGMNFGTYLHQGDPLGKPAVHVPKDIPLFHHWEEAAIHALTGKSAIRDAVGLTENSNNQAAMATFAERYNGLGYHHKGLPSAYVWSATDTYRGGRYVADGQFDRTAWDQRPGVMALIAAIDGAPLTPRNGDAAWLRVTNGNLQLRSRSRGEAVTHLQGMLKTIGHGIAVDGAFGPQTEVAIREFQAAHGLRVDGVVGPSTAAKLKEIYEGWHPQGENGLRQQ